MKFGPKSYLLAAAAPVSLMAAASPAYAQDGESPEAEESNSNVIIVTARKREETLLEAPLAITAFAEEAIEDAALTGLEDISL